jgi:hypothetical protein
MPLKPFIKLDYKLIINLIITLKEARHYYININNTLLKANKIIVRLL